MKELTLEVNNLITFTKAAKLIGVSRPTIYNLINKQKLHPVTIGRNRYLLHDEIQRIKNEKKNQPRLD